MVDMNRENQINWFKDRNYGEGLLRVRAHAQNQSEKKKKKKRREKEEGQLQTCVLIWRDEKVRGDEDI